MEIVAYTTQGCFYCDQLKELIRRADLVEQTKFFTVGEDIDRETFVETFPDAAGFPLVLIDGERVGGLVETAKVFVDRKLVTSRNKST